MGARWSTSSNYYTGPDFSDVAFEVAGLCPGAIDVLGRGFQGGRAEPSRFHVNDNKVMKGALILFTQAAESELILYTAADIKSHEADDQVLDFFNFWKKIQRGVAPTFIFDSKITSYANLSELNRQGVKFIFEGGTSRI